MEIDIPIVIIKFMNFNNTLDPNAFDEKKCSYLKKNLIISENIEFTNDIIGLNNRKILSNLISLPIDIKDNRNHSRQGGEFKLGQYQYNFLIEIIKEISNNVGKLNLYYEDNMQHYALNVVNTLAYIFKIHP